VGVSIAKRVSPRLTLSRFNISLGITTPTDVPTAVNFNVAKLKNLHTYGYKYVTKEWRRNRCGSAVTPTSPPRSQYFFLRLPSFPSTSSPRPPSSCRLRDRAH